MTPSDLAEAINSAPRDTTIVVERNAALANDLHARGLSVLSVGVASDAPSVETLDGMVENWSVLTCRSANAICIGSRELGLHVESLADRARLNGSTAGFRSRGWTRNLLQNFPALLQPSFGAYTNTLRGVPAFVVGAGPSLDVDYEHVKRLNEYGVVIAVNGAARILAPGGVALTVEGNDVRFKLGALDGALRAFSLFSDPKVIAHGDGPLVPIFTAELAAIPEWLTGHQRLACSAFGGTAAVALAERWGCNPIVLVGHDFKLTDGGRVYPECLGIGDSRVRLNGVVWEYDWDAQLKAQPRQNPLHDRCGLATFEGHTSTPDFVGVARWFGSVAARLPDKTFIQASYDGICPGNWRACRLGELLETMSPVEYVISPAENGLSIGILVAWLEDQLRYTEKVYDEARKLQRDQSREQIERVRGALRCAALVEPWSHSSVVVTAEMRRSDPPVPHRLREKRAASVDAEALGAALEHEIPGLAHEILSAAATLRAIGGSELSMCRMAPGAADDLLRCVLRSMDAFDRLPRTKKVMQWLTA